MYWLCFTLLSDGTFGRGEGLAGLVDVEVEHDRYGLPFLGGRRLKGLLNEECANLLYALRQNGRDMTKWDKAAQHLLGAPGSSLADNACWRVGAAELPLELRQTVQQTLAGWETSLRPTDILDSLTTIRHQTAVDETRGVPEEGTLRTMRVILRQTPFEARLTSLNQLYDVDDESDDEQKADDLDLPLLAACVLALRRAGIGRNRGRGRLRATLHADANDRPGIDITRQHFDRFCEEVGR
jgi:hypothetical protein